MACFIFDFPYRAYLPRYRDTFTTVLRFSFIGAVDKNVNIVIVMVGCRKVTHTAASARLARVPDVQSVTHDSALVTLD